MNKALLSPDAYHHVFGQWRSCKACLRSGLGNTGDRLIEAGTRQLFAHYKIELVDPKEADVFFWGGGGNMGAFYPVSLKRRMALIEEARRAGKPLVILPQSWIGPDSGSYHMQFIRERGSLEFCPSGILAPDLALSYKPDFSIPPWSSALREEGFYFREDRERKLSNRDHLGDPAALVSTARDYILLASQSQHIHTDRLHFAIAAMIADREATLYPNSYHKNRAMWDAWLKDLGCHFSEG